MSIKKGQAILKCFKHLEISIWFMPGLENKTMFCDTTGQGVQKLND